VPASPILLIAAEPVAGEAIEAVLAGAGYAVTRTPEASQALSDGAQYHLVVIDVVVGSMSAAEVCQQFRADPDMAGVPVMCISQTEAVDERIAFLEAGADDVMAKPFDSRELEARVEALLLRFQRTRDADVAVVTSDGVTIARARRTVAVFSPKGGVGTTTIATNIAVSKAQGRADKVVLVDLSLQFGGVISQLNIEPKVTLADLVRDETAMREPEITRTYAIRHDSGLHVIASPGTPEGASLVEPSHVEAIIANLLEWYDFVVIDAGSLVDERSLAALEAAESVVLAVSPEISALRSMHGLLEFLEDAGSIGSKATFVLNHMFARDFLKPRDIENALGQRIEVDLPYDAFVYLKAANEGNPVVLGAPRTPAALQLAKLSHTAFADEGYVVDDTPAAKKGRRLGFRRG
jgi:pilus assembly protein CpaE